MASSSATDWASEFYRLGAAPLRGADDADGAGGADDADGAATREPIGEATPAVVEADGSARTPSAAPAPPPPPPCTAVTALAPPPSPRAPPGPPPRVVVFDTETTGLSGLICQLAYNVYNLGNGDVLARRNVLFRLPPGARVSPGAYRVHKISDDQLRAHGVPAIPELRAFGELCEDVLRRGAGRVVAHNAAFDCRALKYTWECHRGDSGDGVRRLPTVDTTTCTMKASTGKVKVFNRAGKFKWPKNSELYAALFNVAPEDDATLTAGGASHGTGSLHDAAYDIAVTARCYFEGRRRQWWR